MRTGIAIGWYLSNLNNFTKDSKDIFIVEESITPTVRQYAIKICLICPNIFPMIWFEYSDMVCFEAEILIIILTLNEVETLSGQNGIRKCNFST